MFDLLADCRAFVMLVVEGRPEWDSKRSGGQDLRWFDGEDLERSPQHGNE